MMKYTTWKMSSACVAVAAVALFSAQQPLHAASANNAQLALEHYLQASRSSMMAQAETPAKPNADKKTLDAGQALFSNNCAFCHGRDAAGGEEGPDLTRSKLVSEDRNGDKIIQVIRNGRPNTAMPAFTFSDAEYNSLQAFIHQRAYISATQKGGRRGVDVSDLQTGNVEAGKQYFEGAGGCAKCHSPTGDLKGIASKYKGLQLEEKMLYPGDSATVTVTTANGKSFTGPLAYRDEWNIGLKDAQGIYHSWPIHSVKFTVKDPVEAHVEQFPKYSDQNIHDLMAYIQTLK
jgi:mono/diheme cytochrome c family protein